MGPGAPGLWGRRSGGLAREPGSGSSGGIRLWLPAIVTKAVSLAGTGSTGIEPAVRSQDVPAGPGHGDAPQVTVV
jgi:hypothetical protein